MVKLHINEVKKMKQKFFILISIVGILVTMTTYGMSVNNARKTITDGLKTALQTQNDVALKVIPNSDRTLTINNKEVTISGTTFNAVKTLIINNNQTNKALIDIVGSQVTDENIALIIYYAQKVNIEPEKLLKLVTKSNP